MFEAALRPVFDDLERAFPGLLRAERLPDDSELQILLLEPDGSGTGLYLGDGWLSDADAIVEVTGKVQEVALEAVWSRTGNGSWPNCPEHPDGSPLEIGLHDGRAFWFCSADGESSLRSAPWVLFDRRRLREWVPIGVLFVRPEGHAGVWARPTSCGYILLSSPAHGHLLWKEPPAMCSLGCLLRRSAGGGDAYRRVDRDVQVLAHE